jgi:hypothetical protein
MSRLEAWFMHITTILITLTGIVYACMHYLMKPADPFSVVNHPLEPYMLDTHIIVAPALVLLFGVLVHSHIIAKLQSNTKTARKSGIFLIPLFVIMVLSGYFLQVITASWNKVLVVIHLTSGMIWFILYIGHYVASYRLRKLMQASAAFGLDESERKNGVLTKLRTTPDDKRDSPRLKSDKTL